MLKTKYILPLILILLIFQIVVLAVDIDIGSPATDRGTGLSEGWTRVDKNNPANATGHITSIEIWANIAMVDCEVATFFIVSGDNLSTRDTHAIGNVTAGSKQTFSGLNIEVEEGDFIGIFYTEGKIEADSFGDGIWQASGDHISCTDIEFISYANISLSLYGTGITEAPPDLWDTYDQRIKLTIDHTKIDDTLSNFPVTAFFTDAQAEEIFAEFDADEDFDRGQFALGDDTLLKAEKELFDVSESKAIYHVKIPSISSSVDTDYYFYYDNDADHNTSYIGIIGSATAAEVWDEYYKLVCHGVDDTTSTVLDSTSNNNDGTKKAANEPVEAAGKVGQGQDFDGVNDYTNLGTSSTLQPETGDFTVEVVAKTSDVTTYRSILECRESGGGEGWKLYYGITTGEIRWSMEDHDGNGAAANADTDCSDGEYHYVVGIRDTTEDELTVFLDGVEDVTPVTDTTVSTVNSGIDLLMGCDHDHTKFWYNDVIDEVRISKTRRTNGWIKATYNSLWDTLLTYGSEETEAVPTTNVMFMFSNF